MMIKYVLDTSFLLALLSKHDLHHNDAVGMLEEMSINTKLVLPGIVFLETALAVKQSEGAHQKLIDFLQEVYDFVEIDRKCASEFVSFVDKTKLNLKPNDYSVLHTAYKVGGTLLTFDGKLNKAFLELKKNE